MSILTSWMFTILVIFSNHPLHVSITEIESDENEKTLKITMRIFMDDLEQALRQHLRQADLDILKPNKNQSADEMLCNYLKDRFKISLDNKAQQTNYLGHETEGDTFTLYMEVTHIKKWKAIEIMNNLCMEIYNDQSNIVNVNVGGKIQSLRLTSGKPVDQLSFDNP